MRSFSSLLFSDIQTTHLQTPNNHPTQSTPFGEDRDRLAWPFKHHLRQLEKERRRENEKERDKTNDGSKRGTNFQE
jgi:hypothetical protein